MTDPEPSTTENENTRPNRFEFGLVKDEDIGWIVSEDIRRGIHVREQLNSDPEPDVNLRRWWVTVHFRGYVAQENPPKVGGSICVVEVPKCKHGRELRDCVICSVNWPA